MKLATRTSLIYTSLTAGILLVFTAVVLVISEENREKEFFDRLGYKITWRAELLFDAHVDLNLFKELHERNKKILNEADVSIYSDKGELIFSDLKEPFTSTKVLQKLNKQPRIKWSEGQYQYMAMNYFMNGKKYQILGRAHDQTGIEHTQRIKKNILIVFVFSLLITAVVGFLFPYYSLNPLKNMIIEIQDITEHRLNKRLKVPNTKDELYELAESFNTTLNRLEKSFNNHRNFVTIISHEFRTPLSSMITELQLAKELNQTLEDYQISIDNALEDAKRASILSSSILDFARASYDVSQISFEKIRIDEVLVDAKLNLINKHKEYKISVNFEGLKEDELVSSEWLEFVGNPYLLEVAFLNLMENACKYSADKTCHVHLEVLVNGFKLSFIDHGIGILKEDQNKIFDLFYRGDNKKFNIGNGIGLSIVKQIIELHKGKIYVKSELEKGTCFTIELYR